MLRYSRREFGILGLAAPLAGMLAAARAGSEGVVIGVQSYSFRDRPLDDAIAAMHQIGVRYCELTAGHVEPRKQLTPEELRRWRRRPPLELFRKVREKFDAAGITLTAYAYSFRDESTEEEIASGFQMAKALSVSTITSSSTASAARRLNAYAPRAGITIGIHNHARVAPNEIGTPADFEKTMAGLSPYIAINLDIGHFTAAGFDPVAFIQKHHRRIVAVHLKDRKKNQGPDVPFGLGDTPVREVLTLMQKERYGFPAMIECEYERGGALAEVRECFRFCQQALAAGITARPTGDSRIPRA